MNKVRIFGIGAIISGILIGYFFPRTDVHIVAGMLVGLGIGWTITGRLMTHPRTRSSRLRAE
ncbi:hypothetical protein [Christiangramia sp. SM2212]|uniref:Uncharacterized protein n=1 Tax=Christiangramia sediminicola TaxID=3073267 RepID=A0ABU1ELH7_9FLAO|nr:hypothetical protein [Christiangramia sp. SM2212]MDR5589234.1 hypothetical protein [Christiangramia sp. SM2212]